ncbi:MAG: hypothetical protein E7436_01510 [Ruminococcaceae bacterium]|nr:hypothetical protein [Oscillospiraceae bacterium]
MMKRFFAAALVLCLLLSWGLSGTVSAVSTDRLAFEKLTGSRKDLSILQGNSAADLAIEKSMVDRQGMVEVFIVMEGKSVLEQDPLAQPDEDTLAAAEKLEQAQAKIIDRIREKVLDGAELEISYGYTWLFNGVAARVPYARLDDIRNVAGVQQVVVAPKYEACETAPAQGGASVYTVSDGIMIGREDTWAGGYTGMGIKIAVIDTGLDVDHQNFQALPEEKLTKDSASLESVAAVLGELNASVRYPGLKAEDVYHNTKVVFGFNYGDDNTDVTHDNDGQGTHGTHVAGIAAANRVEGSDVVGVAPDAQLYIMKIFGGKRAGVATDIVAALEDALLLGADVVNMSLGTNAGFTENADEFINTIYERVALTGTVLSASAGNNYTAGMYNNWGTNSNLTTNPDNAVVGEPSTYGSPMSVASVENLMIQRHYIQVSDGYKMAFNETSASYGLPSVLDMAGEYELAAVPGNGEAADYEGLDVAGKIVLVQRGVINFSDKVQNAENAGAVGCLVYNNVSGEFGMDLTGCEAAIPAASISMEDGQRLIGQMESGALKVSFPQETTSMVSPYAWQMSDFSSWGVAPDLTLEPDITAPGGNIYSTIMDGEYAVMSGTSMAAPNIAGISALVLQYVREHFDDPDQYRALVQNLLVSTASPLPYDTEGLFFSPRQQGSGLANAFDSIRSHAYLTVAGADVPKVSLGDDAQRTGKYGFSFQVTNFGTEALFYKLHTVAQTEGYSEDPAYEGKYFMSSTPYGLTALTGENSDAMVLTYDLDGDGDTDSRDAYLTWQKAGSGEKSADEFRYDLNGDSSVNSDDVQDYLNALVGLDSDADLEDTVLQVPAGETVEVHVDVELSAEDRTYLDTYYTNGGYVEGFTFLTSCGAMDVDLSLPYLAYYGSWDEPPMLDDGNYWDLLNAEEGEVVGNQYYHTLFTNFYGYESYVYPGFNVYSEDVVFDPAHISVSPNGDGYFDTVDDIYTSLLRNAATTTYRYTNMATGEVYYEQTVELVSKSVYNANYDQIIPNVYTWYSEEILMWDWLKADGTALDNNTNLLLEVEVVGAYEGATPEIWSVPIFVDLTGPELLELTRQTNSLTGEVTLHLSFRDNHYVSAVALMNSSGSESYHISVPEDPEPAADGYRYYEMDIDITGLTGKLSVILDDYAMNQVSYAMNLGGEGTPYGQLVGYQYNFIDGINGWVSFDPEADLVTPEAPATEPTEEGDETVPTSKPRDPYYKVNEVQITMDEMNFVCAEYVGGFVYAQTETGDFYGFRYTDMLKDTFALEMYYITTLDYVYQDLAYDYSTGQLCGLNTWEDEGGYPYSAVYTINIHGEYVDQQTDKKYAPYEEYWAYQRGGLYGLCMAIDDQGTIYILGTNYSNNNATELWTSYEDRNYGTLFKSLMTLDVSMDYLQSMTWDHNDETIYWARFDGHGAYSHESALYRIDVDTLTYEQIGELDGEVCALFSPLTEETAAKPAHGNLPVVDTSVVALPRLRTTVATMNVGSTINLVYDLDPWYSDHKEVVWSTSDANVATVDQEGNVLAVGTGEARIKVANKADPTKYTVCTVQVSALTLKLEGIISAQGAGLGNAGGTSTYVFDMVEGISTFGTTHVITATEDKNYGLSLATSVLGRGSIWACEWGNTGMVYQIDAATGEVLDVLQPICGDMLFGMTYNEELDTFAGIMDMYLYVDLELTHEEQEKIMASREGNEFTYHKLNLLPYLLDAHGGFITNETGQGASSEIVMCGITTIPEPYTYVDTGLDFLGNSTTYPAEYTSTQTFVILDNVGRLWYIDEICNMTKSGNYFRGADGKRISAKRYGVLSLENEDGTYNVFNIRAIEETGLTDMFRGGNMPRITYHFSDIEYAGKTADGANMFALSLYDYWNNGTTNELYLCVAERTSYDPTTGLTSVLSDGRLYDLGDTGKYNIIASIHSAEVLGGID